MPIYEFYCPDCDTLFSFFSSRIDTDSRPDCPRCGKPRLDRRPARFATLSRSGGGEEGELGDMAGIDEERLGSAFESVLSQMETSGADAEDPRQMAHMLRAVGEAAGLAPGDKMEEMLRRLEAGEDAERLEEEMGDAFDGDGDGDDPNADPLAALFQRQTRLRGRRRRPQVDEELYFL
jgi:putative FmdB family regulatory protein